MTPPATRPGRRIRSIRFSARLTHLSRTPRKVAKKIVDSTRVQEEVRVHREEAQIMSTADPTQASTGMNVIVYDIFGDEISGAIERIEPEQSQSVVSVSTGAELVD